MKRNDLRSTAYTAFILIVVVLRSWAQEQVHDAKSPYPTSMAPIDQYMMERNAEIALARSAAPESISRDAEVLVLGRKGYETAVQGRSGFVCEVDRSWTDTPDNPEFWNPKRRGPICFNPAAAKSYLPNTIMRTKLVLAGKSKAQMFEAIRAAFERKVLPTIESGAMCYMMSKQGHLSDRDGHWHPHLMFFFPSAEAAAFGRDYNAQNHTTTFAVRVAKWSDGTPDSVEGQ